VSCSFDDPRFSTPSDHRQVASVSAEQLLRRQPSFQLIRLKW
jgi:ribonuclease I